VWGWFFDFFLNNHWFYIFGKENKSESKNGSFRVFETPKKTMSFLSFQSAMLFSGLFVKKSKVLFWGFKKVLEIVKVSHLGLYELWKELCLPIFKINK
jgi:hypothetical protein